MSAHPLDAMIEREGFEPDSVGRKWLLEAFTIGLNQTIQTLRDQFAGLAMQGMNANPDLLQIVTSAEVLGTGAFERMARKAYQQADAMIVERARTEK